MQTNLSIQIPKNTQSCNFILFHVQVVLSLFYLKTVNSQSFNVVFSPAERGEKGAAILAASERGGQPARSPPGPLPPTHPPSCSSPQCLALASRHMIFLQ
jgi:hypothetical protein